MDKLSLEQTVGELKRLAEKTVKDCTFPKDAEYFGEKGKTNVLLPSGDEKYRSFWVRDAAMMAESGLIPNEELRKYIEIFAVHAQNGEETLFLKNGLIVPPFALADHVNYDGKPVFYPGTYASGMDQGDGGYGYFPPFCDNYYFVAMVGDYVEQSGDLQILRADYNGISLLKRLEYAFAGYNIDAATGLCVSDADKYTVDWGFVDTVKKSGKLLMASLLRYNAATVLSRLFEQCGEMDDSRRYREAAEKIKKSLLETFYDDQTGWFYSATGIGHQHDVWATAYAVYLGITDNKKTLETLYKAYTDRTAVVDGYVRHILTDEDFSAESAWESCRAKFNVYQNGAYWATPTGWYAYALYQYNGEWSILNDFLQHTEKYAQIGSPFEWVDKKTENYSGLHYGTSGVLPYVGAKRLAKEMNR